ncbi:AAA family ATPase [Rhizobium leguminosarum]|nr:AAA family ATPase [Rhizobium leguminosarum]
MVCQIRYLSSAGIHPREIPGISQLADAFPPEWLFYTSLQCYPKDERPVEIDALIVMDDRVLLLELKDFHGDLKQNGDVWHHGKKRRFRSPVDLGSMKARKVKSFLSNAIPGFNQYQVDSRVVLTGTSTKMNLSPSDQSQVWSLQEAASIGSRASRQVLLPPLPLGLKRVYQFEADFERVTRNARLFGPLEAQWDGHRVVEEDFVVHPKRIWREHRAEKVRDPRYKALLRIWAFNELPIGLNSPEKRRLIADRESRAIGRLHAMGSSLTHRGGVLLPIGEEQDEILTQHYELRNLPDGFTTLDRYLERARDRLGADERVTAAAFLLNAVAELHSHDIAHRDLGPRSIWAGSPTKLALSGFMASQLPDEESLGDWSSIVRGFARETPEDKDKHLGGTGKQRDVYALGWLAYHILSGDAPNTELMLLDRNQFPKGMPDLSAWLRKSTAHDPAARFSSGREMADEFSSLIEQSSDAKVDQTLLDRFETDDVPYLTWTTTANLQKTKGRHVYVSQDEAGTEVVVKIWLGMRRGLSTAADAAMCRLFDGVSRFIASPVSGTPHFLRAGLSDIGPFVVYRYEKGRTLSESSHQDVDWEIALQIAGGLITGMEAIHSAGVSHGDVSEKNVLIRDQDGAVRFLDLFDISDVGDGRVRTPSVCPDGWENLTEQQIDNFGLVRLVLQLFERAADERLSSMIEVLRAEILRPAINTLDPIATALKTTLNDVFGEPSPRVRLTFPGAKPDFFKSDEGRYYVRASRKNADVIEYRITGIDKTFRFEIVGGEPEDVTWIDESFSSLAHASQHGVPVKLEIKVEEGPDSGFEDLLAIIQPLIALPSLSPEDDAVEQPAAIHNFDVRRYWRKLMEFEAAMQPEVEILQDIGPSRGPVAVYEYQRMGLDFDFDTGSTVEVRTQNGRKVGEVNLERTDANTLVVEYSDRRLVPGDRVNLVDRRSRSSFDRRLKAVERVLENNAAVEDLLEYFMPGGAVDTVDYGDEVEDSVLEKYGLNVGQKDAFRHVARYGPVGLLQGPPGTGKTHFIAAVVHWLITTKGARKILVTSQSHEAVNNVIEALLDLYKKLGGSRPSLLRIGSKGITDKIRPYHTTALRERLQARFESAFKHRVAGLGSALGLKRSLLLDAIEVDRNLGERVRRLKILLAAELSGGNSRLPSSERRQRETSIRVATEAACVAGHQILGRDLSLAKLDEDVTNCFETLLVRHRDASPSDLRKSRLLIELGREWIAGLASPHRNFEEFLAKTRSVITATCVGVGQTGIRLEKKNYDWVIVDEAARCTPGELAVPIQVGRRVLLVGDHRQLLPMIDRVVLKALHNEMPDASRKDFLRSDFERAYSSKYGREQGRTLTEQYRMTGAICQLVSKVFYEPHGVELETSPNRVADPLFQKTLSVPLSKAVTWIDTSMASDKAEKPAKWDPNTFWNPAEVDAVLGVLERISEMPDLVSGLLDGDSEFPIGVICMYSAQKVKIEEAFAKRPWESRFRKLVRIETVDSYQGKENAIVILSLVRSNSKLEQGHVGLPNRCNVALSRAKERLIIIGAKSMWAHVPKKSPMRQVLATISANNLNSVSVSSEDLLNGL